MTDGKGYDSMPPDTLFLEIYTIAENMDDDYEKWTDTDKWAASCIVEQFLVANRRWLKQKSEAGE